MLTWKFWLYWLTGHLRCRIIQGESGDPYLERYHLFRLPGGGSVYIHRFVASDPDRGLHNHPWRWSLSLIMAGGYDELRLQRASGGPQVVKRWYGPGAVNRIGGDDYHRILLAQGTETWSLFAHGGKCKGWGFLRLLPSGETLYRSHDAQEPDGSHDQWWKTYPKGHQVRRTEFRGASN